MSLRLLLVLALVGACARAAEPEPTAEEEESAVASDAPPLPGSGLDPGRYTLSEIRVQVAAKKANGRDWDAGDSLPELLVAVRIDGVDFYECEQADSGLKISCAIDEPFELSSNTAIGIEVRDADLAEDDAVGGAQLLGLTRGGELDQALPMRPSGQILAAWVTVISGDPATLFWRTYRPRLTGLAVGVVAALLILLAFRRHLLRDPPTDAVVAAEEPP